MYLHGHRDDLGALLAATTPNVRDRYAYVFDTSIERTPGEPGYDADSATRAPRG